MNRYRFFKKPTRVKLEILSVTANPSKPVYWVLCRYELINALV